MELLYLAGGVLAALVIGSLYYVVKAKIKARKEKKLLK